MPSNKGSRRNKRPAKHKARQSLSLKERASDLSDSSDQVFEEITALSAIFQEDFKLLSEKPVAEFSIQLRPHSVDQDDDEDVSAELVVRCLPGYPNKPPKLNVIARKGLSSEQSHRLHSLLVEQAASLAREGRVMIFNLTEAGQEYLSENRSIKSSLHNSQEISSEENSTQSTVEIVSKDALTTSIEAEDNGRLSEDFVFFDLFGSNWVENDNHWDEGLDSTPTKISTQTKAAERVERKLGRKNKDAKARRVDGEDRDDIGLIKARTLKGPLHSEVAFKQQDNELALQLPKDNHSKTVSDILQKVRRGFYQMGSSMKQSAFLAQSSRTIQDTSEDEDDEDDEYSETTSEDELPTSTIDQDAATRLIQKDLVLAHLLRLACGARGPLPNTLPILATQLQNLGILPEWVKDLVADQSDIFDATFKRSFPQQVTDMNYSLDSSSQVAVSQFWDVSPDLLGAGNTSSSRYLSDFEEISLLGEGGFGHVVLCVNKLDGRRYAMKKIRLKAKTLSQNNKILREVATLARLQHQHVVRYYQAWIETGLGSVLEKLRSGSETTDSGSDWLASGKSGSADAGTSKLWNGGSGPAHTTYLYIQMEYCPRTLREVFSSYEGPVDKEATWRMFRQIVEGLAHIHSRGIIHRDLTPNNIFFDARNDIKIGDFGLAKFANLEQPDVDTNLLASIAKTSGSLEGTGAVGTYFYTAPEIVQGWPHIDEKVDMYSLGVVLFELWYQFTTAMERYIILNDFKSKGTLPSTWSVEFECQAKLVKWLTAAQPSERPSAVQLLRSELIPPRMQDEALNDILRTIQNAEDTTVYDQVVAAIFDDDRLKEKAELADRQRGTSKPHCPPGKKVGVQEWVVECVKEVFTLHGARPLESPEISVLDDPKHINRLAVKLLDSSGDVLQLRYETRSSFASWVAANQPTSLKRFQIAQVYRRGFGNSAPQGFFQGDFDIVGGVRSLAEAEAIKVATEVVSKFSTLELHEVRVNHRQLLNAIWTWAGVKPNERKKIAQVLSTMDATSPGSTERKGRWPLVRRHLLQDLEVAEIVVDKLQTVERRFLSGTADDALARLRGALPSKEYFDASYFQIHVQKASFSARNAMKPLCLAVGGCYDRLLHKYWTPNLAYGAPGMVGLSIAVQKLISIAMAERKPETVTDVLVCSRGGGGLLAERMQVVAELWAANIKAEYMCSSAPSLTEQYEYAHEHGIKRLVIITEADLTLRQIVKVRHLDLKIEEEVYLEELVMHLTEKLLTPIGLQKRSTQRHSLY
ncbi:eIF-2-alpha kinase GCN2-like isoform X2 [Physcomitrium patens]|uniref:eIF-2-alpha kinase GCN2-like isoform X2 n=1 Tax=Physcomitrium patens TaxID=3218 RepID=UPI003CCD1DC6